MPSGFHKPGAGHPRRDDDRDERPARDERAFRDERPPSDERPRDERPREFGRRDDRPAPNRWSRDNTRDRDSRGFDSRGFDRDDRRDVRGGFDGRRQDDRRRDDRRQDDRRDEGYQGRSYGENVGRGYGKARQPQDGGFRQNDRDERGGFDRDRDDRGNYNDDRRPGGFRDRDDRGGFDDRRGGFDDDRRDGDYRGRDDRGGFRGRDDRGGFDDRRGGYRDDRRDDRRDGGFRGRDDRGGFDDRRGGYRDDRRDGGYQNPRDGYRYGDREQGGESRSQEWKRISRDDRNPRRDFGQRDFTPRDRGPRDRPSDNARPEKRRFKPPTPPNLDQSNLDEPIRLNKYVARSTRYSRKESDDLIKRGRVTVNGEVVGPGTMVQPGDVVLFDEKPIKRRDHLVYILINKPRGIEPTMVTPTPPAQGEQPDTVTEDGNNAWEDDDNQHKPGTLSGVLKFEGTEQLEVVHPLSAEMMGLQLVSNDPELGKHFAVHLPKESYTLDLTAPVEPESLAQLPLVEGNHAGILLAELVNDEGTKLSIVIRGAFPAEVLAEAGIQYERVDRLHFAGLTKKDLPRGHWRFLGDREITWVTMFQQ